MDGTVNDIRDPLLAGQGKDRIEWALQELMRLQMNKSVTSHHGRKGHDSVK